MTALLHIDCMDYMATLPDKAFNLAIVDPPYGIGEDGGSNHTRGTLTKSKKYEPKGWDTKPSNDYFKELFRISNNQIIWGANHFCSSITDSSGWIVWDKMDSENDFSDCEIAFSSFKKGIRKFKYLWCGMWQQDMKNKERRIHPTQKPVALYKWLIKNYAKEGDRILDTHGGGMSIAIACHDLGFDLVCCEKDEDYYKAAVERYENHKKQLTLFV